MRNITPENFSNGTWIGSDRISSFTNVDYRCARFESGLETVNWREAGLENGKITHWYFTNEQINRPLHKEGE